MNQFENIVKIEVKTKQQATNDILEYLYQNKIFDL